MLVVARSGVLSALFVNDTACLLLTPLVLETTAALALAPVPFLLAVAMGANAGSVATIVGHLQNMMVANYSGLSYARFALALTPVALVTLALTAAILLSVATLIVVEQSKGRVRLTLWTYARIGIPLTLASLALGTGWLLWRSAVR